jgi:hypothetical protein
VATASTDLPGRSPAARVAWRPLALPNEHGGWGFLLEPLLLGVAVAPSRAGAAVTVAAIAAFFARHPMRLAVRDRVLGRRYPRTLACTWLSIAYGVPAVVALVAAIALSSPALLIPFALAAPLAFVQFTYDVRNRGRELVPELCGATAAAAGGAACVLAGGGEPRMALLAAGLGVCRAVPTVVYVRSLLRRGGFGPSLLMHSLAVAIVAVLRHIAAAPTLVLAPPIALLIRAVVGPIRTTPAARRIGMEEVLWGTVTTIVLVLAIR